LLCATTYLWEDGDPEGLVVVFTHQVEGDDGEDVPGCRAGLPTDQLLPEPEPRGELFGLKNIRYKSGPLWSGDWSSRQQQILL